ncbi:hypothetical protein RASY3_09240 [Ruminococcus albus SY3]|uniref:Uncharacterized protein n=1 Tax=Ruminococcus albus SY3 TaxID=1341156 RepID=A0A011W0B8_RUMAL|nr:hypothetical protein [Ruminococcus albus]EXM40273.1 hypothetical protein RASY3_09240 [Ruminococcus albus SY3]
MPQYIKQTSRTILFEEFSRAERIDENGLSVPVDRLDFLLDRKAQKTFMEVKDKLIVHSFKEFIEKFDPKYYEFISVQTDPYTGEEVPIFTYSLRKPLRGNATECRLVEQPFYKAMIDIYRNKGVAGESDATFEFSKLIDRIFSPSHAMDEARDIRGRLTYNFSEYLRLEQQGAAPEELSEIASEIKRLRRRVRDEYMSRSQFNLIPLIIQDTRERLEYRGDSAKDPANGGTVQRHVEITFDEKGKLQYHDKHIDDNSDTLLIGTSSVESATKRLCTTISNDFDRAAESGKNQLRIVDDPQSTGFMKKMLLSVFGGQAFEDDDASVEELQSNLVLYEAMYKKSQESFAQNVVSLVEKIINVMAFFDHAGSNAELIVSNCGISELIKESNRANFVQFIEALGNEKTDEKIWFAIMPAVDHKDFVSIEGVSKAVTLDDDLDDETTSEESSYSLTPFPHLLTALELLGKNNIITFFNFKGCSRTSSAELTSETIVAYKNALENVKYRDYAVFCYPNFTILPQRESHVKIGQEYIKLPPVFVDASYIAASLCVSTQHLDTLSSKDFPVSDALGQPVRFDFEGSFDTTTGDKKVLLSQVFATKMNRELILSWNSGLVDEISKSGGFGFCFCGDEKWYTYRGQTTKQSNAYVFRARTLAKDHIIDADGNPTNDERYRPIFKTMVKTYFSVIATKTDAQQIRRICDDYSGGKSKMNINNAIYSPNSSGVQSEETITFNENRINITYDRDSDGFNLEFRESSN